MTPAARLHTIEGHLRAVRRLVAEGRILEAAVQLRAARAAVTQLGLLLCTEHVTCCLRDQPSPDEVTDLVSVVQDAIVSGRRRTDPTRRSTLAKIRRSRYA